MVKLHESDHPMSPEEDPGQTNNEIISKLYRMVQDAYDVRGNWTLSEHIFLLEEMYDLISQVPKLPENFSRNLIAQKFAEAGGGAESVHASWKECMAMQGREITPERISWLTLPSSDRVLDGYIASQVCLAFLDWMGKELAPQEPQSFVDEGVNEGGLCQKYVLLYRDGRPLAERFRFVLSPEVDPAAHAALCRYAMATENQLLRDDLIDWIQSHPDPKEKE